MMPPIEPDALIAPLAHQGGWDEALFVAVPLLIFWGLLRLANRRASRLGEEEPLPEAPSATSKGRISED